MQETEGNRWLRRYTKEYQGRTFGRKTAGKEGGKERLEGRGGTQITNTKIYLFNFF